MAAPVQIVGEYERPDWVNAREAAEYLGVGKQVIHRLVRRGELTVHRSAFDRRMHYFAVEDLAALEARDMAPVRDAAPPTVISGQGMP